MDCSPASWSLRLRRRSCRPASPADQESRTASENGPAKAEDMVNGRPKQRTASRTSTCRRSLLRDVRRSVLFDVRRSVQLLRSALQCLRRGPAHLLHADSGAIVGRNGVPGVGQQPNALAAAGDDGDPASWQIEAGVFGMDGTTILFGDADLHGDSSGGRLTGGYWFTPEHRFGVEGSFFQVDGGETEFLAFGRRDALSWPDPSSTPRTGFPAAVLVSHPGVQLGGVAVKSDMDLLRAECPIATRDPVLAETSVSMASSDIGTSDCSITFPFDESFDLGQNARAGSFETTSIDRFDEFASENEFHGGEVGLIGRWWGCRWALQDSGQGCAGGGTRTVTTIDGATLQTVTNDDPVIPSYPCFHPRTPVVCWPCRPTWGRLRWQLESAAVAELGVRVEYALNKQCRVSFGYTFICWSERSPCYGFD